MIIRGRYMGRSPGGVCKWPKGATVCPPSGGSTLSQDCLTISHRFIPLALLLFYSVTTSLSHPKNLRGLSKVSLPSDLGAMQCPSTIFRVQYTSSDTMRARVSSSSFFFLLFFIFIIILFLIGCQSFGGFLIL